MRNFALEILVKNSSRNGVYIALKEFCLLAAGKGNFSLPVDRPFDQPNGHFYDRCASGRPGLDTESSSSLPVDQPVDQGHFQRAELSGRSTARSTGPPAMAVCTSCARRSTRPVDRLLPRSTGRQPGQILWGLKTWVFDFN